MDTRFTPRRTLVGAAIGLLPVLVSAGYQAYATRRDERRYPPRGVLVDVDKGRRLHVHRVGHAHEGPTVLLEGGMSCPHDVWGWVQTAVSRFAPTISYDRAGIGYSDPGPLPRTAERITEDLVRALDAIGDKGPYVLVGHSFGGLLVRHFAERYPNRVAGVVLIDAAHPEELERSPRQRMGLPMMLAQMRAAVRGSTFGVLRYSQTYVGNGVKSLPEESREWARARMMTTKTWRGAYAEMLGWLEHVNDETRDTRLPAGVPLAVVTAERSQNSDPAHGEFQVELAGLSSNSVHRVIPAAEHLGLVMREDFACHVTRAIEDVVAAARSGRPLTEGVHHE